MKLSSSVLFSLAPLISVVAQGAAVTLTPAPTSITFNYTIGSVLPAAQTIAVRASAGTPAYTLTITGTSTEWLTASPTAGSLPASLSVRANPTSLVVGVYQATLNMTATGVANPLKISVTLNVTNALPTVVLSTASLTFHSPPSQPTTQTFTLTTTGGPVPFTAAAGSPWLSVVPSTGVILPGAPVTVTVSVDSTALAASATAYTGKITITAAGVPAANKTQIVTVSLTVNSLTPTINNIWPPSVLVNTPTASVTLRGTGYYAASVVMIGAQALVTTVVDSQTLIATVPPVLLTTPGNLSLFVANPAPGGSSAPITFTITATPTVQITTNAASTVSGTASPGEIVTMYGQGIGPAIAYSMQSTITPGFVDTTVGGYTVSIDSYAAPILYLSQNQITVQVPYEVSLGPSKVIQISNGSSAASGTLTITDVAPGIFSLDGSGQGQAAALNFYAATQAYALNGGTSAATAGDTVIFYMTGEGDYATTISPRTGFLVPTTLTPLPQMASLPVVTIGGQSATVSYAGPVVGSLLGILQVNATVPAGSATGLAVPVSVQIGTAAAQSGITLVIK